MRKGLFLGTLVMLGLGLAGPASAADAAKPGEVRVSGKLWLATVPSAFSEQDREATYKVFTHIYDFEGKEPITKGPGGKYSHHRGLFIGWRATKVGEATYDTWHMTNCRQEHVAWLPGAVQSQEIRWCGDDGRAFIREVRTISAAPGKDGLRIIDFQSTLTSLSGTVALRGDLQHAGMQVRLANEVSEHEDTTRYILPEGAEELADDKVVGAWWVCCSAVVRGKRYWLVHMTPPDHPTGQPVYSIRRYARFGAFFELDLHEAEPVAFNFRIIVSERELDRDACRELYSEYAVQRPLSPGE